MPTITLVQSWVELLLPHAKQVDIFASEGFAGYKDYPPWHPDFEKHGSSMEPMSSASIEMAQAFWKRLSEAKDCAERTDILKRPGNDKSGKDKISTWVHVAMEQWQVWKTLDAQVDIAGIMEAMDAKTVRKQSIVKKLYAKFMTTIRFHLL
jgi:hypothetical protein